MTCWEDLMEGLLQRGGWLLQLQDWVGSMWEADGKLLKRVICWMLLHFGDYLESIYSVIAQQEKLMWPRSLTGNVQLPSLYHHYNPAKQVPGQISSAQETAVIIFPHG